MNEDTGFGERLGLNLLGIGDCNRDGVVNNYDIDCNVVLLVDSTGCADGFEGPCGGAGTGGGEEAQSSRSGQDDDAGWEHFWDVVTELRARYGE